MIPWDSNHARCERSAARNIGYVRTGHCRIVLGLGVGKRVHKSSGVFLFPIVSEHGIVARLVMAPAARDIRYIRSWRCRIFALGAGERCYHIVGCPLFEQRRKSSADRARVPTLLERSLSLSNAGWAKIRCRLSADPRKIWHAERHPHVFEHTSPMPP